MSISHLKENGLGRYAYQKRTKQTNVINSGNRVCAGNETSSSGASHGFPLSLARQRITRKTRLGISFTARSYLHAWLLLAPT